MLSSSSAAAAQGPAELGSMALPEPSQPGSIGASASRHKARQAKLAEETVGWPGSSARPGGGDADQDPTLACSRAAHRGGLDFPLRRLTAIRDGPSWRRDCSPARPRQTTRSADGALWSGDPLRTAPPAAQPRRRRPEPLRRRRSSGAAARADLPVHPAVPRQLPAGLQPRRPHLQRGQPGRTCREAARLTTETSLRWWLTRPRCQSGITVDVMSSRPPSAAHPHRMRP